MVPRLPSVVISCTSKLSKGLGTSRFFPLHFPPSMSYLTCPAHLDNTRKQSSEKGSPEIYEC